MVFIKFLNNINYIIKSKNHKNLKQEQKSRQGSHMRMTPCKIKRGTLPKIFTIFVIFLKIKLVNFLELVFFNRIWIIFDLIFINNRNILIFNIIL